MDTTTIVTSTVAILTQTALVLKGAKSLLDEYGEDVKDVGKQILTTVRNWFGKSEETSGEIEYFLSNRSPCRKGDRIRQE